MSNVVNKGKRFTPKVKQRRHAINSKPKQPIVKPTVISSDKTDSKDTTSKVQDDQLDGPTQVSDSNSLNLNNKIETLSQVENTSISSQFPDSQSTQISDSQSTQVPDSQRTQLPDSQRTQVPGSQSTQIPISQSSQIPTIKSGKVHVSKNDPFQETPDSPIQKAQVNNKDISNNVPIQESQTVKITVLKTKPIQEVQNAIDNNVSKFSQIQESQLSQNQESNSSVNKKPKNDKIQESQPTQHSELQSTQNSESQSTQISAEPASQDNIQKTIIPQLPSIDHIQNNITPTPVNSNKTTALPSIEHIEYNKTTAVNSSTDISLPSIDRIQNNETPIPENSNTTTAEPTEDTNENRRVTRSSRTKMPLVQSIIINQDDDDDIGPTDVTSKSGKKNVEVHLGPFQENTKILGQRATRLTTKRHSLKGKKVLGKKAVTNTNRLINKKDIPSEDPKSVKAKSKQRQLSTVSIGSDTVISSERRRSSRLSSLSGGGSLPVFKPSFRDTTNNNTNGINGKGRTGKLTSKTNTKLNKMRMNSITENNPTLQAIKKRRMSSKTSVSRKKGADGHRISIISKEPTTHGTKLSKPTTAKKSDGFFQRTNDIYDKYTIRSVEEIPKNILDTDSEKYILDEDTFTMAELCKPTLPIGSISENFEKSKEANRERLLKRKEKRETRKKAKHEFKSIEDLNKEEIEREKEARKKAADELMNAEVPEGGSHSHIQLKINAEGEMVVDDESTKIDRHQNARLENQQKKVIDENSFGNLYNYGTYGKQQYSEAWDDKELIKFYKALSMWGIDFNVIAQLFPYRTRRQIKSKFLSEEKHHPVLIELALKSKLPPDFDQYCLDIRRNIGTIEEYNIKIEKIQEDHEKHIKEIEESKLNTKAEDLLHENNKHGQEKYKKGSGGLFNNDIKNYRKSEVVLGTIDDIKKQREEEMAAMKKEEEED